MFVKIFAGGASRYFRHAPPQTELDFPDGRPANRKLPKPAHRGISATHNSIYFYYWAFLRLNREYLQCCEQHGAGHLAGLYEDFGDVRDGDFITWWKTHGLHCFAEQEGGEVHLVKPPFGTDELEAIDPTKSVLLRIDLGGDLEKLVAAVRKELKPQFQQFEAAHPSTARRKVRPDYQLGGLHRILEVATLLHEDPSLEGRRLGLAVNALLKVTGQRELELESEATQRRLRERRAQAQSIVKWTAEGEFPVYR